MLEQQYFHIQKNAVVPYLTLHTKINSKQINNLNISAKTKKFLGENIGVNLCGLGLGNKFLNIMLEPQVIKEKMDKLDLIKIKIFCALTGIMKNVKRQHIAWEKIPANHISDKGLVSRIYTESLQF